MTKENTGVKAVRKALAAMTAVILTMIAVTSLPAMGQLRYGFRFGGDFAKASLKNGSTLYDAKLSNRSGFSGGLALEYQFEKCGFAPDIALLYTRYNTRLQTLGDKPRSFGRNFIEIPIHLKWKFWIPQTKNLFAPMIYTGPSLMFRLDHNDGLAYIPTIDGSSGLVVPTSISTYRFKTDVFQPGWDVGIGFDIINFIQITAGYRFGLGNALSTAGALTPTDATLRTNAWTLSATLLFDF